MPAADYATLYDFESQLETAWAAAFTAVSVTSYSQQSTSDKSAPYCNIQATINESRREYSTVQSANHLFGFQLEVQVVTNRTATSANTTQATYRGKVRNALERWLAAGNTGGSGINARLDHIIIVDFARTGGNRGVDESQTLDITTETYAGAFQIKPTAWPT